jgi:hypothetical protein
MKKYFVIVFFSAILTGCAPFMYIPNTLNMPLAGDKGEVKGNLYYGSGGIGIQGSYAADSNFVVLMDMAFDSKKGTTTIFNGFSAFQTRSGNFMGDIGAGYYNKISKGGRFELLGGLGYGTATGSSNTFGDISDGTKADLYARFYRLFAQGNIGMVRKNVEFGFGVRISSIFADGALTQTNLDTFSNNHPPPVKTIIHTTAVFVEPCLMLGVGLENVKLNFSFGFSGKVTGMNLPLDIGSLYQPSFVTAGITVNLFRKFPEK